MDFQMFNLSDLAKKLRKKYILEMQGKNVIKKSASKIIWKRHSITKRRHHLTTADLLITKTKRLKIWKYFLELIIIYTVIRYTLLPSS